jgi:ubiquitin C-terminal hydrolase
MNASLQALLHTEPLVEYFLHNLHKRDLNVASRHGHRGRLALAFLQMPFWKNLRSEIFEVLSLTFIVVVFASRDTVTCPG